MTSIGNLEDMFRSATEAPTQESVVEEVIVTKEANLDNLIYELVHYASFLYQLSTQAHLIHFNLEAPYFLSVHDFLKDQYKRHTKDFDRIGELVRSMDYLMPMCQKGLLGACKTFKSVKEYEARPCLVTYIKNLEEAGMLAKKIISTAKEIEAPDVENAAAEILEHCFKSAWMLKAILRHAG